MSDIVDFGPRVGADPEVFVQGIGEDTGIIPVCGKVGGTKNHPKIITTELERVYGALEDRRIRRREDEADRRFLTPIGDYAVQEDNVALEFNIPACTNTEQFCAAIERAMAYINRQIYDANIQMKLGTVDHLFKKEQLDAFPQTKEIGCVKDMWAYAVPGEWERKPFTAETFGNRRFCGGHLHVQYNHESVPKHIFAQFMDVFVTLPFLKHDKQRGRRLTYGQPGIFRKKEYGIEYRTPSSFWLGTEFRNGYLYNMIDNVFHLAKLADTSPELLNALYEKIPWDEVQSSIQKEDHKKGLEIVTTLNADGLVHIYTDRS